MPGPTSGLQSELEMKDSARLFTGRSREPVASPSTRCLIWFHNGAPSPWALPSLSLGGSLEGACVGGGSCGGFEKQGPTHTG